MWANVRKMKLFPHNCNFKYDQQTQTKDSAKQTLQYKKQLKMYKIRNTFSKTEMQ